jgi:hypothetical protein
MIIIHGNEKTRVLFDVYHHHRMSNVRNWNAFNLLLKLSVLLKTARSRGSFRILKVIFINLLFLPLKIALNCLSMVSNLKYIHTRYPATQTYNNFLYKRRYRRRSFRNTLFYYFGLNNVPLCFIQHEYVSITM